MKDESQQAVELPLEGRRRWLIKLAAAAGLLPFLAACEIFDDDDDDDDPKKAPSDLRLKENVRRIGTTRHGLPFYAFSYVGKPGRYAGVMAQDVLSVMPDAVSLRSDGFYQVDYRQLRIRMLRLN
jgi:Chaperone of endosialidase